MHDINVWKIFTAKFILYHSPSALTYVVLLVKVSFFFILLFALEELSVNHVIINGFIKTIFTKNTFFVCNSWLLNISDISCEQVYCYQSRFFFCLNESALYIIIHSTLSTNQYQRYFPNQKFHIHLSSLSKKTLYNLSSIYFLIQYHIYIRTNWYIWILCQVVIRNE